MAGLPVLDRMRPGDHVCCTFTTDSQRLDLTAAYADAGLRDDHKIVVLSDAWTPTQVLDGLVARGVPARAAVACGQLEVRSADDYLPGGEFDPAASISGWRTQAEAAAGAGFLGLRVLGDMAWAVRPVPGADRLAWYEAQVNRVFAAGYAMAMCLYDRRLFDPAHLDLIASAHPGTHHAGTSEPGVVAPLMRFGHTASPPRLALSGEADVSNRHALSAMLNALLDGADAASPTPVTVDVSGLTFADASAVRLLIQAAAAAPSGIRLEGCTPPMARLVDLVGGLESGESGRLEIVFGEGVAA
ncbi:MEDS domain-containing protein [Longispora sp. NPDC051575]|uniref:MEDS domain-containing protein n=1 Tax=Longispora sp. NPDC051575 TaxID=3154943 RepID=UPI0034394136